MPNFTRNAIKQSFLKLLDERSYSDITIKDIVTECGINRNSFYYHFQNMPALVEEIIKEDCDRIITRYPSLTSFEACLDAAIEFVQEHKRAVLHIYKSVDRDIYERYLWEICEYIIATYINTAFSDRNIKEADRKIMIWFYKCECFGQMMAWTENGMKDDIRESFHRLCELKKGHIEQMVQRSEQS